MKDNKFTYEELQEGINELNREEKPKKVKEYFKLKKLEASEKEYIDKIPKIPSMANAIMGLSLKWYIMDKPLDNVKEAMYYSIKCFGDERYLEERHPGINGKDSDEYISGMSYTDYLRALSVAYLLDGYDKEDIKGMEKLIHKIKGRVFY